MLAPLQCDAFPELQRSRAEEGGDLLLPGKDQIKGIEVTGREVLAERPGKRPDGWTRAVQG